MKVAWHQIGCVGLEHEHRAGNLAHERQQMRAASFIANPTGDADEELQFEVALKLARGPGEAMRDGAAKPRTMLTQNRDEIRVRIALMQEHGLAAGRGNFELAVEGLALRLRSGEIAIVVKAALTDRDELRRTRKLAKFRSKHR